MATRSKHSIVSSIGATSRFSIKSAKSAIGKAPKTRACPWVAQWFTIPQALLKPVQVALGVSTAVLILLWESEGVTIASLTRGDVNYRNELNGFVGISLLTVLYSIGMATLGISGLNLPPFLQVLFAGVMLALWVFGAPTMSASVTQLNNSPFARDADLNTLYLQVATALGFVTLMAFVFDILLAFMLLGRVNDSPKQLSRELYQSKSSLTAVRSGKSISTVATKKKKSASDKKSKIPKVGSSSKATDKVDERSPLKSGEETPGDEDDDDLSYSSL